MKNSETATSKKKSNLKPRIIVIFVIAILFCLLGLTMSCLIILTTSSELDKNYDLYQKIFRICLGGAFVSSFLDLILIYLDN
jgi:hypothetical protein